jgi:branched-chain amino acid transport system permease protein
MTEFLQQLLNGISLGAIYALIALGYTMVYGVLRFINFAHSDVFMVGAFAGYYLGQHVPAGTIAGGLAVMLGAMVICAILGMSIERLAYRPLRGAPTLNVLITAIGVSLFLEYTGQLVFGATPRTFPQLFPVTTLRIGALSVSSNQLLVIGVALVLMIGLQLIVFRTRIGTAMRAVSLNPNAARLVGVNNDVVISFTFGLGSALAAAGGILYAMNYPSIDPLMGVMPGLKSAEPMPKPLAPAVRKAGMLSGEMPPTGKTSVSAGSTARRALSTGGVIISAGNIFNPLAPAARAAKASLAVMTPGRQTMPRRTASAMRRDLPMPASAHRPST